jgi:hypothetical protein
MQWKDLIQALTNSFEDVIKALLPSPRQQTILYCGLPVDPKEDLLWPLLSYERPQLQQVLFWTSRKPTRKNLPGSY